MPGVLLGFVNIDKPEGVTAHDVVAKVRKILNTRQVGHGGTLDPMATGVLPIAVGKATRLLRFLPGDKTYLAEITLGIVTDTDDITGKVLEQRPVTASESDIREGLTAFTGTQQQVPPLYSAIHIDGERLYNLARSGNAPDTVPARTVTVHSIEFVSHNLPVVVARISCGAGTYIRSIARDLGRQLGCGGCLSSLVREQAGPFKLSHSVSLDQLCPESIDEPSQILELPKCHITDQQLKQLLHGQAISIEATSGSEHIMAIHNDKLVAIARLYIEADQPFAKIQPEVVIADAI